MKKNIWPSHQTIPLQNFHLFKTKNKKQMTPITQGTGRGHRPTDVEIHYEDGTCPGRTHRAKG